MAESYWNNFSGQLAELSRNWFHGEIMAMSEPYWNRYILKLLFRTNDGYVWIIGKSIFIKDRGDLNIGKIVQKLIRWINGGNIRTIPKYIFMAESYKKCCFGKITVLLKTYWIPLTSPKSSTQPPLHAPSPETYTVYLCFGTPDIGEGQEW